MNDPLEGIAFYAVFVFAVTIHEAAHAWAAMKGGDLTAYRGGQVSLDPIPHMKREPFGMVVLPVLSVALSGFPIGYASAPFDPAWAERHPRRAAWMSLAGPGANLAVVAASIALIRLGVSAGLLTEPSSVGFSRITETIGDPSSLAAGLAFLLSISFTMNLLLFVLNIMPIPPLDGSGALPLLLPPGWVSSYQTLIRQPMVAIVGILIVWNMIPIVFAPCFRFVLGLIYPGAEYV